MKEAAIQRVILDYLAVTGVLAFRMNTGAVKIEKRFMRFGSPGMADILAFKDRGVDDNGNWCSFSHPVWIECKAEKGVQSDLQRLFQQQVEAQRHTYVIARSVEDVMRLFGK